LLQLCHGIKDNTKALQDALASDLGRPEMEANFLEIGPSIGESLGAYKSVSKWAKPESVPFTLNFGAMRGHIRKEPKGVVLIIV
jgi:aldehyde dehydrogenase (NAD+)/aldehyde dehydrogenase (NAD(P)+)